MRAEVSTPNLTGREFVTAEWNFVSSHLEWSASI